MSDETKRAGWDADESGHAYDEHIIGKRRSTMKKPIMKAAKGSKKRTTKRMPRMKYTQPQTVTRVLSDPKVQKQIDSLVAVAIEDIMQKRKPSALTPNIDGWLTLDCELVAPANMSTGHLINTIAMVWKTAATNQRGTLLREHTDVVEFDEQYAGKGIIDRLRSDCPVAFAMVRELAKRFGKAE